MKAVVAMGELTRETISDLSGEDFGHTVQVAIRSRRLFRLPIAQVPLQD
jgi:hypothetical protein